MDGYDARTDKIIDFARVMIEAATNIGEIKARTPMVEGGWFGAPLIITPFLGRLNGYAEEWAEAAGILKGVLDDDAPRLIETARAYRDANENAEAAVVAATSEGR